MRKISFFTLFFSLFLVSCCFASENNFRDTRWGMSPGEVKTIETEKLIVVGESGLQYSSKLFEKKCIITYLFSNKKELFQGIIQFKKEVNSKKNYLSVNMDYMDLFSKINNILEKKYKKSAINNDELDWKKMTDIEREVLLNIQEVWIRKYESKKSRI